jgi:hypothetical protein
MMGDGGAANDGGAVSAVLLTVKPVTGKTVVP